jgi:hypothetical protein
MKMLERRLLPCNSPASINTPGRLVDPLLLKIKTPGVSGGSAEGIRTRAWRAASDNDVLYPRQAGACSEVTEQAVRVASLNVVSQAILSKMAVGMIAHPPLLFIWRWLLIGSFPC